MTSKISIKNLVPAHAIHPGEFLKDELKERKIKQIDFAIQIGMQKTQLNELINGKRNMTAEIAMLLEKTLNIKAYFWLNAQNEYDLDLLKIAHKNKERLEALDIWAMLKDWIPYKYFIKEKVFSGDPIIDVPITKHIYNVSNYDDIILKYSEPRIAMYRKSEKVTVDKINLLGWEQLVIYKAHSIKVEKFDIRNRNTVIEELKNVFVKNKNTIEKTKAILANHGIKLYIQANPEKCAIDGMAFWSNGNPAIALSLRHNRIDYFAFTLLHELGHVYLHLTSDNEAQFLDIEDSKKTDQKEKEANEFANECYMPSEDWQEFVECYFKPNDIDFIKVAKKYNIHPAMILGRYCYQFNKYNIRTEIDKSLK